MTFIKTEQFFYVFELQRHPRKIKEFEYNSMKFMVF